MLRRALMAFSCLVSVAGLSAAADATTFGFGFAIDIGGGYASVGLGNLFTTDNGDNSFTVTGASGAATFIDFDSGETYAGDTIVGAGPSWFAPEGAVATITFADGVYSFDNLQLHGENFYYDFSHYFGPQLVGLVSEVGGEAQFSLGPIDGAVPEVATWGMMVMGFGAMGAAMRRRTTVSFA